MSAGYLTSRANPARCLDHPNTAFDQKNFVVQMWGCNYTATQVFVLRSDATLLDVEYGRCLTGNALSGGNAALVSMSLCDRSSSGQKWDMVNGALVHRQTGRCLELVDNAGAAGSKLMLSACDQGPTQAWSGPTPLTTPVAGGTTQPAFDGNKSIDDLLVYSLDSTHSDATPMGIHYQSLAKTPISATRKTWLQTASSQPRKPDSASSASWKKFNVVLYPWSKPVPADVNQHAFNNCSSGAVLASLAFVNPDFVQKMIMDNKNGTFTVSMYDPAGKQIAVSVDNYFLANSAGSMSSTSGKKNVATWTSVVEKATMKYIEAYPIVSEIDGIGSEYVSPMLVGSGDSVGFYAKSLTASQMIRAAKVSLATSHLVVGGFAVEATTGKYKTVTSHAWTILPPFSSDALFAMRNPWGVLSTVSDTYDGATDGVLPLPMSGDLKDSVDMRIMSAGAATGPGVFTPYTPPPGALQ